MYTDNTTKIDKEALRMFAAKKLAELKHVSVELIESTQHSDFWHQLHNHISTIPDESEKQGLLAVESQLLTLPLFLSKWLQTSVASTQSLEFFIAAKAEEIKSGDQTKDYFWALQIRHDQIQAVITVIERLLTQIKAWINQPASTVVDNPIYQGLTEFSIEDQIYLEAENIHKRRQKNLK